MAAETALQQARNRPLPRPEGPSLAHPGVRKMRKNLQDGDERNRVKIYAKYGPFFKKMREGERERNISKNEGYGLSPYDTLHSLVEWLD